MGLEYRLSRNDHKVVEDLLATRYRTLDGIAVEAHNIQRSALFRRRRKATAEVHADPKLVRRLRRSLDASGDQVA